MATREADAKQTYRDYAEPDTDVKPKTCAKAAVPEYAIVDPAERQLRLYALLEPGRYAEPNIFHEPDKVTFACLPTISFVVADLFADAPDTTL